MQSAITLKNNAVKFVENHAKDVWCVCVYLSLQCVCCPQRHGQLFAVPTDELHMMKQTVLSVKHHRWATEREVGTVCTNTQTHKHTISEVTETPNLQTNC